MPRRIRGKKQSLGERPAASPVLRSGEYPSMHPIVAALLCSQALLVGPADAARAFPYRAVAVVENLSVRSGPGKNYYPTDTLAKGQAVEVYRHDPNGWCAIRPIDGSFTWVSGRFLRPLGDNLAEATDEGVSARVGSRLSDARDVIQVRLRKGEVVEILETPRDGDLWFKISPPAGEFRWVSEKYIRAEAASRHDDPAHEQSSRSRAVSPAEFKTELESIELALAVMVIEEPAAWSFGELQSRTNVLLDVAHTAIERGHARLLADRLARFENIKQRQETVLAMRGQSGLSPAAQPGAAPPPVLAADDGRFDGVGRLTRVESPKAGAPRYALMSDYNEVLCYVTPAPGVNLHNYLGRQVGVNGTRGYIPEQRTNHVTARHVAPLTGRTIR